MNNLNESTSKRSNYIEFIEFILDQHQSLPLFLIVAAGSALWGITDYYLRLPNWSSFTVIICIVISSPSILLVLRKDHWWNSVKNILHWLWIAVTTIAILVGIIATLVFLGNILGIIRIQLT